MHSKQRVDESTIEKKEQWQALCELWKLLQFFCDQMSFVSINSPIRFVFKFVNPFIVDNITIKSRDKVQCIVVHEGSEFFFHGK